MKKLFTVYCAFMSMTLLCLNGCKKEEDKTVYIVKSTDSSRQNKENVNVPPHSGDNISQQSVQLLPQNDQRQGNALSRGNWRYISSFPNNNGITTNHVYVDPNTQTGSSIVVMTRLEYGNLHGWSLIYRKETDCYQNFLRTISTVSWYNNKGNYAKETQPNNPNWQRAKNFGDQAIVNYVCHR